jgi:hypothetical protein
MNVYIHHGDLICEECACDLGLRGVDCGTEYPDGGGESDSPQHCGMGADCVNAEDCPSCTRKVASGAVGKYTHKVGVFLENPLTTDGLRYLARAIKGDGCVARDIWAPFYEIDLPRDGYCSCIEEDCPMKHED